MIAIDPVKPKGPDANGPDRIDVPVVERGAARRALYGAGAVVPFVTKGSFSIRECTCCGLRFTFPQPSDADIESLYDER